MCRSAGSNAVCVRIVGNGRTGWWWWCNQCSERTSNVRQRVCGSGERRNGVSGNAGARARRLKRELAKRQQVECANVGEPVNETAVEWQ